MGREGQCPTTIEWTTHGIGHAPYPEVPEVMNKSMFVITYLLLLTCYYLVASYTLFTNIMKNHGPLTHAIQKINRRKVYYIVRIQMCIEEIAINSHYSEHRYNYEGTTVIEFLEQKISKYQKLIKEEDDLIASLISA